MSIRILHSAESEPAKPTLKVIGLGLGRTGTLSLCLALEILGFGPCHHPICLGVETDYWGRFAKATKGDTSPEILNDLYRGFVSALDNTTALLAEKLYKAYPNAKFILTVRDPTKWARSMKKTIIKSIADHADRESRIASGTATEDDRIQNDKVNKLGIMEWLELYNKEYHQSRLEIDPEGEFLRHNQRIIKLVAPEKLLIFDVAEGWKPLTDFLEVPEPNQPFPNVNDSNGFNRRMAEEWSKSWLSNGHC